MRTTGKKKKKDDTATSIPFFRKGNQGNGLNPVQSKPVSFFGPKSVPVSGGQKIVQTKKKKPLSGFSKPGEIIFSNDSSTEKKVDQALSRSPVIAPFIKDKLKAGVKIQGQVTYHYDWKSFENEHVGIGNKADDIKSIGGFYDRAKQEIHLPPAPRLESLIHEAVHKFSNEFRGMTTFINEGLTQLFTNIILLENGLSKGSSYKKEVKVAEAICAKVGGMKKLAAIFFTQGPKELMDTLLTDKNRDLLRFLKLAQKKKAKKLIKFIKEQK